MVCDNQLSIKISKEAYNLIYNELEGANQDTSLFCLIQVFIFGIILLWLIYRLIKIFIWCKQNMQNIFLNKFVHIHLSLIACHILLIIIESFFYTHHELIKSFAQDQEDQDNNCINENFYKFAATQDLLYYFLFFCFCLSIVLACIYWFNIIFNISNILILVQILLGSLIFVFAFIYKIFMDSATQALSQADGEIENGNDIFQRLVAINYYFYHYSIMGIVLLIGVFFIGSLIKIKQNLEKIYMISYRYKIKLISENVSIAVITLTKLTYHILCLMKNSGNISQQGMSYFSGCENIICYGLNGFFLSNLFFPTRQIKMDTLNTFDQNMEQEDENQQILEAYNPKKSDEYSFVNQKGEIKQE
ncbi:hypothetical protein ABPG72_012905 [Tetrahymena utriculariae]